ncbi:alpha-2-macroglobulin-like [Cyprinodon tularosa]|uniref:alpha-2-macroglobulin-like n=1 Tax=Cyprinodon tularosa TaxID=77115 RepID=UPI0018E25A1C|nr:alpha-2-macroglobulin-like [Cyprinodon tularosa]
MGRPGNQMWTCTLWVFLCGMFVGPTVARPHYMVTIPAILEAGTETKFCASLIDPSETLTMTVSMRSDQNHSVLYERTSREEFLECIQFQVPLLENEKVAMFEVEVRGNTFNSKEVRKVMIKVYRPVHLIQTDKPIYLPGQTVQFRVVSMDSKLRPINQLYNFIELEDSHRNRIGQWFNQASNSKILQLSYPLNSEAREGIYKINVKMGGDTSSHTFKVEKYVLPKFDINMDVKEETSIAQEEFEIKACLKYTYGQPVQGNITVEVCPLIRWATGVVDSQGNSHVKTNCATIEKQTDKTGCAIAEFKMSSLSKLDHWGVLFDVWITGKEEGTGVSQLQKKRVKISYVIGKLAFVDPPRIYEKGTNLEGKVKAVHYNNTPISHMPLYLLEGRVWSPKLLQNLTTDSNGFATFSVSTDKFFGDTRLIISSTPEMLYPQYRTAHIAWEEHTIRQSRPPSVDIKTSSVLKIKKIDSTLSCDKEVDISIDYTVVHEPQGSIDIVHLVLYGGTIGSGGQKQVQIEDKPVNEGQVSFSLNISPDMAPLIQVVAYAVLPSENVIAASAEFSTEKCFSNKVSLELSPSPAVPGEEIKLQLMAQPDSLCGISAVDQSVLIKEPGKTLDKEKIFGMLPVKKISHIPYQVQDEDRTECLNVRPRRYVLPHPGNEEEPDTVFQNVGLKTATNLVMRLPSCLRFKGRYYAQPNGNFWPVPDLYLKIMHSPGIVGLSAAGPGMEPEPVKTVRTFFPETWIWDLMETGPSGTKDVSFTVPDTITTWETETFCLSSQGFGLAPRQNLTVFQPFFLELTLPYSIIRGENFEMKATVFNYLTKCIMVKVIAEQSSDYTLTPLSGDQYTSCLCANERKTLSWTLTATALGVVNVTVSAEAIPSQASCDNEIVSIPDRGRIDVVTRPLIVKAEGVEVVKTHNWLLCPKGQ